MKKEITKDATKIAYNAVSLYFVLSNFTYIFIIIFISVVNSIIFNAQTQLSYVSYRNYMNFYPIQHVQAICDKKKKNLHYPNKK